MRIKIYENLRVVSYAPCYLAESLKLFAKHGVDVEIVPSPNTAETAAGLLAGRVQVSWGGPMRVMLHHNDDSHCPLVCFCEVVGPEPFVLVGRVPQPAFQFTALRDLKVGIVTEVPTPWLLLQEDLRRAGMDPSELIQGSPRSMAENISALAAGDIDVAQVMEPYTELAIQDGAHLWHAFSARGDVAFTSFYTTRDFLSEERESCEAISAAMHEALQAMYRLPVDEIVHHIAPKFPALEAGCLSGAITRYQEHRVWPETTALSASAFVRLKGALLSGGFIQTDVPYAAMVASQGAI